MRWKWLVGGESRLMSEYQRGDHEAMHCLCFNEHVTTRMVIGAGYLYSTPSTPQPSRRDVCSHQQPKVPQCETSPQMQGKRRTQRMSIRQKERPQGAAKGPDPSTAALPRRTKRTNTALASRRSAMQLRDSKRDRVRRERRASNPIIPTSHPPEYEVPSMDTTDRAGVGGAQG